jgi:hypothetical protein
VPGPLALAGIIRRAGYTTSARPIRHASVLSVLELADRAGALAWLARNPGPLESDERAKVPGPAHFDPPSPAPLALSQPTSF